MDCNFAAWGRRKMVIIGLGEKRLKQGLGKKKYVKNGVKRLKTILFGL